MKDKIFFETKVSYSGLMFDFSNDSDIENLVINIDSGIEVSSVTGHQINRINLSGKEVVVTDLCMLISKGKMEMISDIEIQDATLKNFDHQQFKNCGSADAGVE